VRGSADAVLQELVDEGAAGEAELGRGAGLVAVVPSQRVTDELGLVTLDGLPERAGRLGDVGISRAAVNPRTRRPFASESAARNASTRSGMSSLRSRSGGKVIATTLKR
jgi:hypothetical protein